MDAFTSRARASKPAHGAIPLQRIVASVESIKSSVPDLYAGAYPKKRVLGDNVKDARITESIGSE